MIDSLRRAGGCAAAAGFATRRTARRVPTATGLLLALAIVAAGATPARAVPSFARQTGMPCTACHTAFPQLTMLGREFKALDYTMSAHQTQLPPVAIMLEGAPSFTHTSKDQAKSDVPSDFNRNDNVALNQASLF